MARGYDSPGGGGRRRFMARGYDSPGGGDLGRPGADF